MILTTKNITRHWLECMPRMDNLMTYVVVPLKSLGSFSPLSQAFVLGILVHVSAQFRTSYSPNLAPQVWTLESAHFAESDTVIKNIIILPLLLLHFVRRQDKYFVSSWNKWDVTIVTSFEDSIRKVLKKGHVEWNMLLENRNIDAILPHSKNVCLIFVESGIHITYLSIYLSFYLSFPVVGPAGYHPRS